MQDRQDQPAKRRETKERERDKANQKLRRMADAMLPVNAEIDECQRKIDVWLASQPNDQSAEHALHSIDGIRAGSARPRARGVSAESYQKMNASEQKVSRRKEAALLHLPEGRIETVCTSTSLGLVRTNAATALVTGAERVLAVSAALDSPSLSSRAPTPAIALHLPRIPAAPAALGRHSLAVVAAKARPPPPTQTLSCNPAVQARLPPPPSAAASTS